MKTVKVLPIKTYSLYGICSQVDNYIMLLCYTYSSVRLERCVNSTLVLGAVRTTVVVNKCENVTMVTACQSIHIR